MHPLRKRHSWPPLRKPRAFYFDESIDQDPFSYFISPAEDRNVFVNSHLTADIDSKRRSRSFSPSNRDSFTIIVAADAASRSPTAKLKEWIDRMELRYFHRTPKASEKPTSTSSPSLPNPLEIVQKDSPPVRGRNDFRIGSRQRVGYDGRSKPRRPRVWREPSENIWPVSEEGEDEIGLGIMIEERDMYGTQQMTHQNPNQID